MFTSNQFLIYKLVPGKKPGKMDKIPCCPYTMQFGVNPMDSSYHTDFNTAKMVADACGQEYGVGFVFTANDPYFFIDIDSAYNGQQWSQLSQTICSNFPGAYVEVSQSGTGLHIIGRYQGVAPDHSCKNEPLGIECYTQDRFVALTGLSAIGDSETDHTRQLAYTIEHYFPPAQKTEAEEWRDEPVPEWAGSDDDNELIQTALNSRSANAVFNGRATFSDLWNGNVAVLATNYPSDTDDFNRSQADAALAQHLAFWTGKNHARIERLMRQSALYRDKWDKHRSYLSERTIGRAVGLQKDVYYSKRYDKSKKVDMTPVQTVPSTVNYTAPQTTVGDQFMTPQQQLDYFSGCVYIRDIHKVWIPDGSFLRHDQFKASFGGFIFSMDGNNDKVTKNAWECFTESQAIRFPKVSRPAFRPELTSGEVFQNEGLSYVNTYVPVDTKRVVGDVTPFLKHMEILLPDPTDREILLCYMAACVQYKGVKFQWCPLVQGAEGNGKTLMTRVLSYAIGDRYTHLPNAKELGDGGAKFTAWIQNKLFIGVEEIYVSDRKEVSEALKVFITNDRIEIQGKGTDQVMGDNRANFLMCSNHKDALHVTLDSRRYAIFYCNQQSKADKIRDGLDGTYFPNLYNWLKNEDGYAIVNEFLHTYQINENYNPATLCQEAPTTSSTREAVKVSTGGVEQEIIEAIEEGRPGFNGGWISTKQLDKFMKEIRAERKVPMAKRRDMLEKMGFIPHPHLDDGRVNNPIPMEDNSKPRLYIKAGHINCNITNGVEIVAKYCKDQGYAGGLAMVRQG